MSIDLHITARDTYDLLESGAFEQDEGYGESDWDECEY